MYSFPNLEPVHCPMSGFNCCFLTCIQVSQEAGKLVWYSQLFKNSTVCGTSLAVKWLRLCASTARGAGSIPGQGTKIPHALCYGQNIKGKNSKQKIILNLKGLWKFFKDFILYEDFSSISLVDFVHAFDTDSSDCFQEINVFLTKDVCISNPVAQTPDFWNEFLMTKRLDWSFSI